MNRMLRQWLGVFLLGILMAGCGYTTRSTLPPSIKTIYVAPFKNEIILARDQGRQVYLPLMEVDVRNKIIDRFMFDGRLRVAKENNADLILKGSLKSYRRGGLRYTENDDVEEYRIYVTVDLEMYNTRLGQMVWREKGFTGEAEYFIRGPLASSESDAIKVAIEDLARRIVERTIEDW